MTASLRMRVVEAGARKICYERDHPSELTEYPYGCRACVVLAEETLDAMLDVLAENADEWWHVAKTLPRFERGGPTMDRRLLEALREDR